MAILFAGTGIQDFPTAFGGYASNPRQSPYCLEAVTLRNSMPAACAFAETAMMGVSGYYFHYRSGASADLTVNISGVLGRIGYCRFIGHTVAGIYIWNGTSYAKVADAPTTIFSTEQTRNRFAVDVFVDATAGYITMHLDGTVIATWTGNTSVGGNVTGLSFVDPREFDDGQLSGVIVADESAAKMRLVQTKPSGAGGDSGWTGTFADVDEVENLDSSYIGATVPEQTSTFVTPAINTVFNSPTWEAVAVSTSLVANSRDPVAPVIRSGSTVLEGPGKAHSTNEIDRLITHVNPANGQPWTYATASAAQPGVRLK